MDELERRLLEVTRALKRKKVTIGVPSDAKQPSTGKGEPPPLAVIAYQNEFGDDELHIPPRPFLIPGMESVQGNIVRELTVAAGKAMDGDLSAIEEGLLNVGALGQSVVKAKLLAGPFTPLKPTTIKARARRKDEDGKLVNTFGPRQARQYLKLQREGVPTEVLDDAAVARPLYDTGALYTAIVFSVKV